MALAQSVADARRDLDHARDTAAHPVIQQPLRRTLLRALENYAAALDLLGTPVPYGMRDEIQLYRHLGLMP